MRRILVIALFLVVASGVFIGAHVYIARRLVFDTGLEQPWRGLSLLGIGLGAAAIALHPFAERLVARRWARVVAWPGSLWMGFAFLLIVLLGVSDVLLGLVGGAARAASEAAGSPPAAGLRAAGVLFVAATAGCAALRSGLAPPRLRRVEIELERWPRALDGFRIAQISDLHIGSLLGRGFARAVTEHVNALAPDLVAVTGDLVDGRVSELAFEVEPFAGLRGRCGVFFVTGNHDHYSGADDWVSRVQELGIRVLRNERVAIGTGEDGFDLVGVDDHRGDVAGGGGGEDLERALAGRDPSRPAVLLAHDPTTFRRAARMGVDLQLSGHTHGGQIWPFGYLVRLAVPWVAGRHRAGAAQLYVSRGTGFWGPPMRLFAPAEVTELVIRRCR